uniref:Uncharacterized protein n=1 Tax=Arundo donax TaxID=35708 RepID=A0A0A9GQA5_ARUDO
MMKRRSIGYTHKLHSCKMKLMFGNHFVEKDVEQPDGSNMISS